MEVKFCACLHFLLEKQNEQIFVRCSTWLCGATFLLIGFILPTHRCASVIISVFYLLLLDDGESELMKLAEGTEANATPTPVILAYKYAKKHGKSDL